MATIVDTNILFDIVGRDANFADWSLSRLESAASNGKLVINAVIFAELSVRYPKLEELEGVVEELGLTMHSVPPAGLFLAGKAFSKYKSLGGTRTGVLSDFFIGAHAAVTGLTLLTRDPRRYRTYFPTVELIAPN